METFTRKKTQRRKKGYGEEEAGLKVKQRGKDDFMSERRGMQAGGLMDDVSYIYIFIFLSYGIDRLYYELFNFYFKIDMIQCGEKS